MKSLIFVNPINYPNPQFSPPIFFFHFPSFSRGNQKLLRISTAKLFSPLRTRVFGPLKASSNFDSVIYGGWDDSRLGGDWANSGESAQLKDFLVSIGIDDKRHVFTFLLGFFCAFGISRVRVSSIIVFPASVLVFAVGFSFGFVRGGSFSEFGASESKRKAKEDIFRIYSERLRNLVAFFDGLDSKVNDLKVDIQRAIESKKIELSDLRNYVNVIESIRLSASDTRNIVEETIGLAENSNELTENQKSSSKKKKDIGDIRVQLLKFVGSLFVEKLLNSKPTKVKEKDSIKRGFVDGSAHDQTWGNSSTPAVEGILNSVDDNKGKMESALSQDSTNKDNVSQNSTDKSALDWDEDGRIKLGSENGKMSLGEIDRDAKRFVDSEEYYHQKNRSQFLNAHQLSWRTEQNNKSEKTKFSHNLLDSVDFRVSLEHTETESSFVQERMFKKSSRAYGSSHNRKTNEDEIYKSQFTAERMDDDNSHFVYHHPVEEEGACSSSSSSSPSMVSDDLVFNKYLIEANNLLKQAKDNIRGKHDEEQAEIILYESAKLLCKATTMKPMSLLAIGQLGNTYLLHGELKLRISRELRSVLSRRDASSVNIRTRFLKGLNSHMINKDKIASVLVDVCEECEELLVEAGRKYRLALSIDGNDVRSLYNWGLALSFRAQLIADIGPEAAFDADQVFLAAIDKFDAMMSKGNFYASDALFRWGVVLQQRSRLRPTNSKEKVKLLQQAMRLYEDALHMDSDNLQVKDALLSCVSELNHRLL